MQESRREDGGAWTGDSLNQWPPLGYGAKFTGISDPWNYIQNCAKMEDVFRNIYSGKP